MRAPERSALEWLRQRRDKAGRPLLSDEEFRAGERLRSDFERAQLQPRITSSWTGQPVDGRRRSSPDAGIELRDYVNSAQERVRRALSAVGAEHASILIDVCCLETGLAHVERTAGWPQRSGKVVLQIALRQLARHYGLLAPDDTGLPTTTRIRQWGTADYRGDFEHWRDDAHDTD